MCVSVGVCVSARVCERVCVFVCRRVKGHLKWFPEGDQ